MLVKEKRPGQSCPSFHNAHTYTHFCFFSPCTLPLNSHKHATVHTHTRTKLCCGNNTSALAPERDGRVVGRKRNKKEEKRNTLKEPLAGFLLFLLALSTSGTPTIFLFIFLCKRFVFYSYKTLTPFPVINRGVIYKNNALCLSFSPNCHKRYTVKNLHVNFSKFCLAKVSPVRTHWDKSTPD